MTYLADKESNRWGFWDAWANGTWEPKTHAAIDLFVDGGTFVDIGAWVGPTTIWAAKHAKRIIAVEPDPTARAMLERNLDGLAGERLESVEIVPLAIGPEDGTTTVSSAGNSMSRTGQGGVDVEQVTIMNLFMRYAIEDVDLIKIDIEGAEAAVLPQAAYDFEKIAAPIHLSTHPWNPLDVDWFVGDKLNHADTGPWAWTQLGDDEWLLVP